MSTISVVINCDTRGEKNNQTGLFNGVVNLDFLTDGVYNKKKAFDGFDIETIVFVDKHNEIPQQDLEYMYKLCDTVVIRKHTHEEKFNDNNYVSALMLARGEYVVHFDQDENIFTSGKEPILEMIDLLEQYDYISYPSHWSPNATHDPNYDYMWCSTRFFMCKRKTLDFTEIKRCLSDSDYLYSKYPASVRNPWTEHILGLTAKYSGRGVFYPPIDINKIAIFTWGRYETYTLRRLNEFNYDEIKEWLQSHPINYPNDIFI